MSTVQEANRAIISPMACNKQIKDNGDDGHSDKANNLPKFGQEDIDCETQIQHGGMTDHGHMQAQSLHLPHTTMLLLYAIPEMSPPMY